MVSQPGEIRSPGGRVGERRQRPTVKLACPVRRDRSLDRKPRQFVPELDAGRAGPEHSRRQAFLEPIERSDERLEEPELRVRRGERGRLEHDVRGRRKPRPPRKHRVPHRPRDAVHAARERLDHEERVSGGHSVELAGVDGVGCGELCDSVGGERHEIHMAHRVIGRELAEHAAQRMRPRRPDPAQMPRTTR